MSLYLWIRKRRAIGLIIIVSLVMLGLVMTRPSISTYRQQYGGIVRMERDPQYQEFVEVDNIIKANKENHQPEPQLLQNTELGGCSANLDLLFLVTSEPRQHIYRNAIRNTWAMALSVYMSSSSRKPPKVELVFVMGLDADPMWHTLVAEEARVQGDVIQYDLRHGDQRDVIEDIVPLLWVQKYCVPFGNTPKYVMKCESTQYVNVGMVETLIGEDLKGNLVIGDRLCPPTATLTETYSCLQQNSYVMSGHLLSKLDMNALRTYKTDSTSGHSVFTKWTCSGVALSLVCQLATEKCVLVPGLPHTEYKVLWTTQFQYDPSRSKLSC